MTREEELDWLYRLRSEIYVYMPKEWIVPMNNALDAAIKSVEQGPCDDVVDRKALHKALYDHFHDGDAPNNITEVRLGAVRNFVKDFPSATLTRKKGKWIVEVWSNKEHYICSSCQHVVDYEPCYHYCPYCGMEMEVE